MSSTTISSSSTTSTTRARKRTSAIPTTLASTTTDQQVSSAGSARFYDAALQSWLWASVVVFAIHELEEIATVAAWLRLNRGVLPDFAQPFAAISTTQFSLGVGVLAVAFTIAAIFGVRSLRRRRVPWLILVLLGALFGNAVTHLGQALYFRGYTPGLISAVLIVLPFCVLLGRAFVVRSVITARQALLVAAGGFALQLPIIYFVLRAVSGK